MRSLKTGLNAPFYKWIDDVKKAIRHKRELEEKLEYYQSRLTGYQAVVYDSIGSSSSRNNVEDNLLFIIGKIDSMNNRIHIVETKIKKFKVLKSNLNNQQCKLVEYLIETSFSKTEIAKTMMLSRSRVYYLIQSIIRNNEFL